MNNGKFRRRPHHFHTRNVLVLVSLVLVIATAMGATLAFLITNTGDVKNAFTPSQVTSLVVEDEFHGETKSNVKIQNTGDIDAYIRAEVIVTWKAENGDVLSYVPEAGEEKDYTIAYANDGKWFPGSDGYWYYTDVVAPFGADNDADKTSALITNAHVNPGAVQYSSEGENKPYYVSIEILSSAIQADGVDANGVKPAVKAWGDANGGSVTRVEANGTLVIDTNVAG